MQANPLTLQSVLDARVQAHPERPFLDFVGGAGDGTSWTWSDARTAAMSLAAGLQEEDPNRLRPAAVSPGDTACIMYTSGTTGPAKGVMMPEAHVMLCGQGAVEQLGVNRDDCYYVCLPLFHINALGMQMCAVMNAGARAVIRERFSASAWLADIRAHRCTVTNMLGALADFVVATEPSDVDRDHALRLITVAPSVPVLVDAFLERFGVTKPALWGRSGRSSCGPSARSGSCKAIFANRTRRSKPGATSGFTPGTRLGRTPMVMCSLSTGSRTAFADGVRTFQVP